MKNFSVKTADFKSLSISGESPIVQSDLGTAPNQIPLNKDLGSLAYMNAPQIEDLNVDTLELREIAAELSDTAVDVFVYDTRKDSDGGAWRSRTQHTSWHNEELNTATRGGRREFPAVAVIVAESGNVKKLKIYDGDDPDLPLWMSFEASGIGSALGRFGIGSIFGISSVYMLNGLLCVTGLGSSGGNIETLCQISFIDDVFWQWHRYGFGDAGISERNEAHSVSTEQYRGRTDGPINVHSYNDVAMTVLPNAPIDDNTGLPIPTIAVATDGGVSIIKHDGSVVDITVNNASYSYAKNVNFTTNNDFITVIGGSSSHDYIFVFDGIPNSDNVMTIDSRTGSSQDARSMFRKMPLSNDTIFDGFTIGSEGSQNQMIQTIQGDRFACGNDNDGLTIIDDNDLGFKKKNLAYISSTYNTGWMPGDIKLATLSDTKNETVGVDESTELINLNDGYADGGSWTINSNTQITASSTASSFGNYRTGLTTQLGKKYTATLTITNYTGSDSLGVAALASGEIGSNLRLSANGTITIQFNGSNEEIWLFYRSTNTATIEISIKETGELITNGTFDDGTTGWTITNNAGATDPNDYGWSVVGGAISSDGTASVSNQVYQLNTFERGKKYILSADVNVTSGYIALYYFTTDTTYPSVTGPIITSSGSYSISFIGDGTNRPCGIYYSSDSSFIGSIDNVSLRLAEDDRSVNDNGLQVFGEITKSPVAPGADLVAYSGFSADNYLMQPYNSDLDFGTGDFCVMGWIKPTASNEIFLEARSETEGRSFAIQQYSSKYYFYVGNEAFLESPVYTDENIWTYMTFVRKNGIAYIYRNGILISSDTRTSSVDRYNTKLFVGCCPLVGTAHLDGSMALWRISATVPTPEQISKIYRDEKVLFTDGAQATLYGTSDAVTALAYDDKTELLHVGTSSGRSDFSGLRRINNTTTAVTTSISASNNLIAEQ